MSITQPIDTTSATGRLIYAILAAVAEMERDLIVERVREGMRNAQRKGARIGRPSGIDRPAFARQWPAVRAEIAAGTLSPRAAATRPRRGHPPADRPRHARAPAPRGRSGLRGGAPKGGRLNDPESCGAGSLAWGRRKHLLWRTDQFGRRCSSSFHQCTVCRLGAWLTRSPEPQTSFPRPTAASRGSLSPLASSHPSIPSAGAPRTLGRPRWSRRVGGPPAPCNGPNGRAISRP